MHLFMVYIFENKYSFEDVSDSMETNIVECSFFDGISIGPLEECEFEF